MGEGHVGNDPDAQDRAAQERDHGVFRGPRSRADIEAMDAHPAPPGLVVVTVLRHMTLWAVLGTAAVWIAMAVEFEGSAPVLWWGIGLLVTPMVTTAYGLTHSMTTLRGRPFSLPALGAGLLLGLTVTLLIAFLPVLLPIGSDLTLDTLPTPPATALLAAVANLLCWTVVLLVLLRTWSLPVWVIVATALLGVGGVIVQLLLLLAALQGGRPELAALLPVAVPVLAVVVVVLFATTPVDRLRRVQSLY